MSTTFFSRTFASDSKSPHIPTATKLSSSKKHSVVLPLGTQRVYVPSQRLEEEWNKKMKLVRDYLALSPHEKEYKLMELSLNKFYRTVDMSIPEIQSQKDLEDAYDRICSVLEKEGITPMRIDTTQALDTPDYMGGITASINHYFASKDFNAKVMIQSVTEYYWHYVLRNEYAFPFGSEREDLSTMIEFGLPYLDETTLYHEAGCGSGEGLIEVLCRGHGLDRVPGSIVGSDVNRYSLESTKLLVEELFGGLDNIFLRYGNAADSLEDLPLHFTPKVVVVGANRFFSILEPKVFHSVVQGFCTQMKGEGYLVAGISVNSDKNLQMLEKLVLKRSPDKYDVEENELGIVVYRKNPFAELMEKQQLSEKELIHLIHTETQLPVDKIDISKAVDQILYDPKSFRSSMERHTFETMHSKYVAQPMHYEREVVLFRKQANE